MSLPGPGHADSFTLARLDIAPGTPEKTPGVGSMLGLIPILLLRYMIS